ncbi:hypothetical protein TREMEDRAFT_64138 [Tremella mesenterica DSM 1558]|uniref:uncharacterized protein n=1 Tax=Tremella mesenterica (strain ATCC 24925 / CBS 8224 / DSM 1558 / NBRC 9311 / NRRL Y-6157 / RJB 2259-6 / UBC 559-6) TaxID=578456 RepID=UPI0003F499D4|nr:uncharacterized protein TREMEDRAFT_64138 [Tremella mesenterica DSM 1558]EIW67549.1 hypothetical protein TREMEDRAFT_64138 [Tremella mesenterica DSM 1558]
MSSNLSTSALPAEMSRPESDDPSEKTSSTIDPPNAIPYTTEGEGILRTLSIDPRRSIGASISASFQSRNPPPSTEAGTAQTDSDVATRINDSGETGDRGDRTRFLEEHRERIRRERDETDGDSRYTVVVK